MKGFTLALVSIILIAGCASNGNNAKEGQLFADKKGVFLSEKASSDLTNQAFMMVNSATTVVPQINDLDSYNKAFNTSFMISNFLFNENEKMAFRDALTLQIEKSPSIILGDIEDSDIAVYSLCSYELIGNKAVLELIIGASDWSLAKSSNIKGADAFFQTTVWYAVSRKVIPKKEIFEDGVISTSKLLPHMVSLIERPTSKLLKTH